MRPAGKPRPPSSSLAIFAPTSLRTGTRRRAKNAKLELGRHQLRGLTPHPGTEALQAFLDGDGGDVASVFEHVMRDGAIDPDLLPEGISVEQLQQHLNPLDSARDSAADDTQFDT